MSLMRGHMFPLALFLAQCLLAGLTMALTNITTDASALLALKYQLTIAYVLSQNWSGSTSVCSWIGVTCGSRHQRVTALNISSLGLQGDLPPEMGNLTFLVYLNLSSNNFIGEIPRELGNLQNLEELDMGNNLLTGSIPASIFNISSLLYINLESCALTGALPSHMCSPSSRLKEIGFYMNELAGELPEGIGKCSALEILSLSNNNLTGTIPRGIGNLTMLQSLYIGNNNLIGTIPEEIGNLHNLEILQLGNNSLWGSLPTTIFNISTLEMIALFRNQLSGNLPSTFGYGLPNLEGIYLFGNNFTGEIPHSISNCSKLILVALQDNYLGGLVPNSLGDLSFLEQLFLTNNELVSDSLELNFVTSLTNCRNLQRLDFSENFFNGILPISIANLSTSLRSFYSCGCGLYGTIPMGFGNLTNLIILSLLDNQLRGPIPETLGNLQQLQGLALLYNRISGPIPDFLCELQSLNALAFDENQFTGAIPYCIKNLTALRYLEIAGNKLNSSIPASLSELNDLLELNLSSNSLIGSLPPNIGNLEAAILIDLSMNQLSGIIPASVGDLQSLIQFTLAHNQFQESIPESIGNLANLQELDLSHNNLSGSIPKSLEELQYLTYFNVSFNVLSGQIPFNGPFNNFSSQSFMSNEGLCGDSKYGIPPCPNATTDKSKKRKMILRVAYALLGIAAPTSFLALIYLFIRHRRKEKQVRKDLLSSATQLRVSYYDLVQATEEFSDSNLLGTGGFSSVYKGTLQNQEAVAVKVFNSQLEGTFKSFNTECEVLRSLRHRNLCKVITACSNEDFKALVLEFMPNGSLEKWLCSDDCSLDIMQRINITIDVACALEYLHHGYSIPIVHCDVKPSNVLLDEDMVSHLSDFGIAKLLGDEVSFAQTTTFATLGYIAPEYGSEGLVSVRSDVYSYGIMLMEIFTRMNPNNEIFMSDLSLRSWVSGFVRDDVTRILDPVLLKREEEYFSEILECLSSILELALKCTEGNPKERISMKDVVVALKKIRSKINSRPRRVRS